MASTPGDGSANANPGGPKPNDKMLNVWSVPVEEKDKPSGNNSPTISEAVSMIKTDDFKNVASTPCARNGFLAGIASGFGVGGLRFILRGNPSKAANWAVGSFLLGSVASYEYCQYLRRVEKREMKRHIEVVHETRKEQALKLQEKQKELKLQKEQKAPEKAWYKFW